MNVLFYASMCKTYICHLSIFAKGILPNWPAGLVDQGFRWDFRRFFLRSRVLLACGCLFLHSQDVFFFRKLEFVLRIGHLCRKMKTKSFASLRWLSIHYIYIFVANWFCRLWIFDGSGNVTKTLLFVNIVRFVFLQCPSPSWTPNVVWELPIANQSNFREICDPH